MAYVSTVSRPAIRASYSSEIASAGEQALEHTPRVPRSLRRLTTQNPERFSP
jgi:hypothetical protein